MPKSSAENLIERVQDTLRRFSMLEPGERVLVAVSGGPDSVCLLNVLRELGYSVEIAHFDHQTREGESAIDAQFVRTEAEKSGCPFHLGTSNVAEEAQRNRCSFEEQARESRYAFFNQVAGECGIQVLSTGHNADDQAETVLMRVIRGTSSHGLGGIPPVNKTGDLRVVRPLIRCTRDEIMGFLTERGISCRTDHTNAETVYLRNRIRHELLPLLKNDFNPSVNNALCRLAESARCENDLLQDLANAAWEKCVLVLSKGKRLRFDRNEYRTLHGALQRRLIAMAAWHMDAELPFDRIMEAVEFLQVGLTGNECDLGAGLRLRNGRETAELDRSEAKKDDASVRLPIPGEAEAFGKRLRAELPTLGTDTDWRQYCHSGRQVFDLDVLGSDVTVRYPRTGDRFRPLGLSGTKKLGDYFTDLGVPIWKRESALLLVADGRIAWVIGHAMDGHFAVTAATRRILEVTIEPAP